MGRREGKEEREVRYIAKPFTLDGVCRGNLSPLLPSPLGERSFKNSPPLWERGVREILGILQVNHGILKIYNGMFEMIYGILKIYLKILKIYNCVSVKTKCDVNLVESLLECISMLYLHRN
jgi:hypothetical protein